MAEFNWTQVEGNFTPLRDGILVRGMEFGEVRTRSGLIIPGDDGKVTGIHPRWGEVIAVGLEQKDVSVGQYVMVAHGRWSRGFSLNGETVRTVDPKDILGVQDDKPGDEIFKASTGHQTRAYEGKVSVGKLDV